MMRERKRTGSALAKVNGEESGRSPLLLCFSHLRWNFVTQRPQHLMRRAARKFRVLFLEEPVFSDSGELPRLEVERQADGVTVAVPVLRHGVDAQERIAAQRDLVDAHLAQERPQDLVFWYYTPMALQFSRHLRPTLTVYDCMDELSAFRFADSRLPALESELLARADLVFTGGRSLYEAKRGRHANIHAFPSSIDKAHFGRARRALGTPPDQADIPHPRLGFFGVIDERLDLHLLATLADLRPDWQLVMIGPVAKIDEATLPQRPNLHWLGSKAYDDLPAYLSGWDIGFMPFALNEATRFISPTKMPEFLAAGLPVVSTPIADVIRPYGERGLVEIARDAAEFARAVERLLARDATAWRGKVDAFLAGLSWDGTWAAMETLMRRAAARRSISAAHMQHPHPAEQESIGV